MTWICPRCQRTFGTPNQMHSCVDTTIDDLLAGKPDAQILLVDRLLVELLEWPEASVGTSKHAIVFSRGKAFLIVKPMTKEVDLKFYLEDPVRKPPVKKCQPYGNKFAHHLRLKTVEELTPEVFSLIRKGYDWAGS